MKRILPAALLALSGAMAAVGATIAPLPVSHAPFEKSDEVAQYSVKFASWPFFPDPAGKSDRSPETWAEFRSGDKTVVANGYDRRVHVLGRTGFGNILFYRGGTDDFYIDYKYFEPFARKMLAWLEIRVLDGSESSSAAKDLFADAEMAVDGKNGRAGWKHKGFCYTLAAAGDGMLALDWRKDSGACAEFCLHVSGNSTNGVSGVENGTRLYVNRNCETERVEIAFPDGEVKKSGDSEYVWRPNAESGRLLIDLCGSTLAGSGAAGVRALPLGVIDFSETDALDVPCDPTGNLLVNGGFEQGLSGWEFTQGGAAWAKVVEEGGEPFERITGEAKCGRRALLFKRNSSPGIRERLQSLPMSLEPGKSYVVSAWIGCAQGEVGSALAEVRPVPATAKGIVELAYGDMATCNWKICAGEWKFVEVPFRPKTGDCKIVLGGDGGAIIDGIRVERETGNGSTRSPSAPQCVEACLVTSDPDNDLTYGSPIEARIELSGPEGAEGAVRVTIRNFYNEIVYRKPFWFKLPETREVALDFDPEKLGTGVFVLGTEFATGGKIYCGPYQRFSIVKPLDGTHATANFYVQAPFWERTSNGEKRAAYAKARGMTTTSWAFNARFAGDDAPTARLRRKYGITARLHCLSTELAAKYPDRFSHRNPQGFMSFTNVVPEKVAFVEREAYEAGMKAAPDDNWWTLWNEEDISLPTVINANNDRSRLRAACEAWFPYQEACRRGLKKAFDERGIELKFAPTHGCATYTMDEWRRDMMDNFIDIAAKHGVKYDVVPIHTYYAVDNSCLGRGDRDADAAELLARLDRLGYADTPVMFSEGFNMLPFYIPQWGVRGWGDDYQTGWTASLGLGWREFIQASAMARLYIMDLKYWPRVLTSHTWQHRLTVDAAMSPCFWTMVPNTLGHLLPSPKFIGYVKRDGWRAYVFRQGGYGVAAVWTNDRLVELGRKKGMTLMLSLPEDVRFVDLMGNRRATPSADDDGTIALPLTPAPLFIVSRDAECLLKEFKNAKF